MVMKQLSRRKFSKRTATAGIAPGLGRMRVRGGNHRTRLGFIGLGNRGDQVLDGFLEHRDAEVVAICDLHQPYLDFAAKKIGTSPRQFKDYQRLLDLRDVDAAVICTPDHWHALQTIHACQAGKDVYVEKPLSLSVEEGRRMVEAARRYGRGTPVGLMRRSPPPSKEAADLVPAATVGEVLARRSVHAPDVWH